jgi:hypothetical protein
MEKGVKTVGMSGPEGQDLGSPGRQDNGSLEADPHLVQDCASVHGSTGGSLAVRASAS